MEEGVIYKMNTNDYGYHYYYTRILKELLSTYEYSRFCFLSQAFYNNDPVAANAFERIMINKLLAITDEETFYITEDIKDIVEEMLSLLDGIIICDKPLFTEWTIKEV